MERTGNTGNAKLSFEGYHIQIQLIRLTEICLFDKKLAAHTHTHTLHAKPP